MYSGNFMKNYRKILAALKTFNEKYSSEHQMYSQQPDNFRKNTVIYLDNSVLKDVSKAFKQKPSLTIKRDKLFKITSLNPCKQLLGIVFHDFPFFDSHFIVGRPYLYGLSDLNGKRITGMYFGRFFSIGPPKYNKNMFKKAGSKKQS